MERVFLQEQKRYTEDIIFEKLKISRDKGISIIRRLKEHGVLKAVKKNSKQKCAERGG